MNFVLDPFVPYWAMAAIAAIGFAVAAVALLANWKSGVFRLIAIAALTALVANPLVRQTERTGLDDIVLILVDASASQSLDGRDQATDKAVAALEEKIRGLNNVEIRKVLVEGTEETRIVDGLQAALADIPHNRLGGVFIITDGEASDAETPAPKLSAPIHMIVTGSEDEIDRKITLTNAPRYGIVDQPVRVSFRVDDLGPDGEDRNNGAQAEVVLRVNGREVLRQPVPLGVEAGFEAPLDRPGATIIELEVADRDGELTAKNNIAVLPISAIRDRLRVLLISGEPHPGERVWRNLLKSDPAVDLVHFTILRPIEKDSGVPVTELALIPFPENELFIDKLTEFDLLIFDRYTYRAVLDSFHFDNIARYVEGGGAVLVAAGPEYNGPQSLAYRRNLSFILPARPAGGAVEAPFRAEVSELGERHPVTADLPEEGFWGRWLRIMPVEQERGATLMTGTDDAPLLILDRVGEGRVGLLLSDHVWLWARGFDGGGPHAELLRRIAHWLMKEPELEEESLSLSADGDALVITRRTIGDEAGAVTLEMPDGEIVDIDLENTAPGLFAARIEDAPRGLYRARDGQLFAIGEMGLAAAPEFVDVISTTKKLAPLAKESGGGAFRTGGQGKTPSVRQVSARADRSGDNWAGVLRRSAAKIDAVRDAPLAPSWAWLALVGLALLLGWAIEGGRLTRKA